MYIYTCIHVCMYKKRDLANIKTQLAAVNSQLTASYRENQVIICIHIYTLALKSSCILRHVHIYIHIQTYKYIRH
jgi:hypothetical protein